MPKYNPTLHKLALILNGDVGTKMDESRYESDCLEAEVCCVCGGTLIEVENETKCDQCDYVAKGT